MGDLTQYETLSVGSSLEMSLMEGSRMVVVSNQKIDEFSGCQLKPLDLGLPLSQRGGLKR